VKEPTTPDVRLTRSKDGSSGTATFVFNQPSVFEASGELGDITGLYLIDTEGELSTVDVQVSMIFVTIRCCFQMLHMLRLLCSLVTLMFSCLQAKFVNGKPDRIEAKYVMRSALEWDRFMRFMERYAEEADLGFTKS